MVYRHVCVYHNIQHTCTVLLIVTLEVSTKSAMLPNTVETSMRNSDVWRSVELAEMAANDDTTALTLDNVSSVT